MIQCATTVLLVLYSLVIFSHAKGNQCSGGHDSCPDDSTCCVLSNGSFGCCPIQNAVCCEDTVHCCPDGYSCDVIKGICKMGRKSVSLTKKIPSQPIMKVPATKKRALSSVSDGTDCPDKNYQCPQESTCCKLQSGTNGCCPLENAVCCSDHKHCCPEGYTCDVETAGECIKQVQTTAMFSTENLSFIKTKISASLCKPGKCNKTVEYISMIENIPAIKMSTAGEGVKGVQTKALMQKISAFKTKISPALHQPLQPAFCFGGDRCKAGQTCCDKGLVGFFCCPWPHASCCGDGKHCCPFGWCQLTTTGFRCRSESQSIALFQKVPRTTGSALESASDGTDCPDKNYQCTKESTCCKLQFGTYGCCPLENAFCCSDHKHCCPEGYTCDKEAGKCSKTAEHFNIIKKIQAIKMSIDAELKYINCPDGCSCFDNETCCELANGHYGCCPSSKAVCCSDDEHCCPSGFRCDHAAKMCVSGIVRLAMLKKAKSSRRPKTQQ